MKLAREAFYRTMDMEFEKGIRTMGDVVAIVAGLKDSVEGISAYIEKRGANWEGK